MSVVLIAGCGYVGTALAVRLAADGHVVYGLRRDPGALPREVRPIAADLYDRASIEPNLPEGVELVVYAAAAAGPTDADYAQAYVRGPSLLIEALARRGAPVRRIVFTSSTGVYAQAGGDWVDEASRAEPTEPTGRRLLEGEAVVQGGPFEAIVLRLAGIYGPGRTRLMDDVAAGRARLPRDRPRWTNRIHRDDCAGALAHLLGLVSPAPLYLGVDREPADLGDVMTWIAGHLGQPVPPVRDADQEPRARMERGGNKRCSSTRLVASGYTFAVPSFREGYAALAAG